MPERKSQDWSITFPLLAALIAACGAGSSGDPRVVTDSAGVDMILIRPADALGMAEVEVDPTPQISIGVTTGPDDLQLFQVAGALRLPDGRIVVGNGGTRELRFYDSDGRFSHVVGGDGEGPGEFRSIDFFRSLGADTIVVYDGKLQRISLFDEAGAFLGSHRLWGATLPYVVGAIGSRTLVSWQFLGADEDRLGVYTASMEFGTVELLDGEFRTVGTAPSSEEARVQYQDRVTRAFRPFGRASDVAAGGNLFFVLDSSDDRGIRIYDAAGTLKRILRIEIPREVADGPAVDAWVESWMARFSTGSAQVETWWRHGFREIPPPEQIPVFRSLEVDSSGNVCAERYPFTWTSAAQYWCFSPEGHFVRSIRLPGGLLRRGPQPHFDPQLEIGSNYVLGVWQDELDVEHVRLYRLGRRSSRHDDGVRINHE